MKYFYDTEFLDNGKTIDLISIGIVCDDGREYHAVNVDCDFKAIVEHDWLWKNVCPHLPTTKKDWSNPNQARVVTRLDRSSALMKPKWVIANEVRDFLLYGQGEPELWAYFGAYDHVALAQLWGPMCDLPEGIPMWTHDLLQLMDGNPLALPRDDDEHDALADARWNKRLYDAIMRRGESS